MAETEEAPNATTRTGETEKSFFKVVVHSFFVIPFLIAVFGALLFAGIYLLTREQSSVYDYLEDVKTGGATKRWQGAFELSRILANPGLIPNEERFVQELIHAFEQSQHDDPRTRQYIALAMGRSGKLEFVRPITNSLSNESETTLPALIYALGMLGQKESAESLYPFTQHQNGRIRSIAVAALGTIANPDSRGILIELLNDPEPNVQWGAAVSLAKMHDASGKSVLMRMLDREYWLQFSEVDGDEQNNLFLTAIQAAGALGDQDLIGKISDIARTDPSMKMRASALAVFHK